MILSVCIRECTHTTDNFFHDAYPTCACPRENPLGGVGREGADHVLGTTSETHPFTRRSTLPRKGRALHCSAADSLPESLHLTGKLWHRTWAAAARALVSPLQTHWRRHTCNRYLWYMFGSNCWGSLAFRQNHQHENRFCSVSGPKTSLM